MKTIILLLILQITIIFPTHTSYAQFYQEDDYGDISVTRKNQLGGYDYYNEEGDIVGYSEKTHKGNIIYYNTDGNIVGHLKQKDDGYTFYNADGIPTGDVAKTPMGEYRYKDSLAGGLRSVTPPPGEDIGFVPPSSFQKGGLSPELGGVIDGE